MTLPYSIKLVTLLFMEARYVYCAGRTKSLTAVQL